MLHNVFEQWGLEVVASLTEEAGANVDLALVFRHLPTDRLLWAVGDGYQSSIGDAEPHLYFQSPEDLQPLTRETWDDFVAAVDARFTRPLKRARYARIDFLRACVRMLPPAPTERELSVARRQLVSMLYDLRGRG